MTRMTGRVSKVVHQTGIRALSPAWRSALLVFLVTRLALAVWMWGVRQVFDQPISADPVLRPYLDIPAETNPWLEPWPGVRNGLI